MMHYFETSLKNSTGADPHNITSHLHHLLSHPTPLSYPSFYPR